MDPVTVIVGNVELPVCPTNSCFPFSCLSLLFSALFILILWGRLQRRFRLGVAASIILSLTLFPPSFVCRVGGKGEKQSQAAWQCKAEAEIRWRRRRASCGPSVQGEVCFFWSGLLVVAVTGAFDDDRVS